MGTKGRIEVEIPFNIPWDRETRIYLTADGAAAETITFPEANQYTLQAELFGRAIVADTEVAVPVSDAVANMRVIDEILTG